MTTTESEFVPALDAARLDGVRSRRVFAFLIDYILIALLIVPFAILIGALGALTLGFGWALYGILGPAVALTYVAVTLGGPGQATAGMRWMGLRIERLDGAPIDGITAIVHTVLFWASNAILSPLALLATLFTWRKRTLHDILLGTQVIRDGL